MNPSRVSRHRYPRHVGYLGTDASLLPTMAAEATRPSGGHPMHASRLVRRKVLKAITATAGLGLLAAFAFAAAATTAAPPAAQPTAPPTTAPATSAPAAAAPTSA